MAIFTGTPVVIRDSSPWFWMHDYGSVSEFAYGGARYVCGMTQDFESPVVGKSTDNGSTWTVYIGSETGFSAEFLEMVLDSANDQIVWIGRKSNQLATFYFDLASPAFSSPVLLGSNTTSDNMLAIRPNGEIYAFYAPSGVTPRPIRYVQIVGGAFGTPTLFATITATALSISGVGVQSDGTLHVLYRGGGSLYHRTLDPSNVIGSESAVDTDDPLLGNILVDAATDSILAPIAFMGTAGFYRGTPISAPVWSKIDLNDGSDPGPEDQEICCLRDGSLIKFFFLRSDFGGRVEVTQVTWDGSTVGAMDIWWDLVANRTPGTEGNPADEIFTDGITALLHGGVLSVVVTASIDTSDMSNVYTSVGAGGSTYRNRIAWEP